MSIGSPLGARLLQPADGVIAAYKALFDLVPVARSIGGHRDTGHDMLMPVTGL